MKHPKLAFSTLVLLPFLLSACGRSDVASDVVPTATPEPLSFTAPGDADFPVPLSFMYGAEWEVQVGTNAILLIHKGSPPAPESEWWGATIAVIDGALVHDPASAASEEPATPDKSQFVPWPKDMFTYLSSIPGVKALGVPTPIGIAGLTGTKIVVQTPPMQPIFWLKDDRTWLGGGTTGVEPAYRRQLIFVETSGQQLMLEFKDSPEKYDEHYLLVRDVFDTLKLGQ